MTFAHSAEVVALKREIKALKAENTEMLMEICALRAVLDAVAEPPEQEVSDE